MVKTNKKSPDWDTKKKKKKKRDAIIESAVSLLRRFPGAPMRTEHRSTRCNIWKPS